MIELLGGLSNIKIGSYTVHLANMMKPLYRMHIEISDNTNSLRRTHSQCYIHKNRLF